MNTSIHKRFKRNKHLKSIPESDDESDENSKPLTVGTQSESKMFSEWLDQIDDIVMPRVRLSQELLSREDVPNSTDTWNGSPVVNYKTFRKCLTPDDRTSDGTAVKEESVECVALKIYDNPLYASQRSANEEVVAGDVKREVDSDFDEFGELKEKKISLTPIKSSQKRTHR